MRNIVKVKAHVCTVRIELKQDTLGFDFIYLHSQCGIDMINTLISIELRKEFKKFKFSLEQQNANSINRC